MKEKKHQHCWSSTANSNYYCIQVIPPSLWSYGLTINSSTSGT